MIPFSSHLQGTFLLVPTGGISGAGHEDVQRVQFKDIIYVNDAVVIYNCTLPKYLVEFINMVKNIPSVRKYSDFGLLTLINYHLHLVVEGNLIHPIKI